MWARMRPTVESNDATHCLFIINTKEAAEYETIVDINKVEQHILLTSFR